jgi:hypothetical protein
LDISSIGKIVRQLVEIMQLKGQNARMIWAIGKAHPSISSEALLRILQDWAAPYNADEALQAIMALDKVLDYESGTLNKEIAARVRSEKVRSALEAMARSENPQVVLYSKQILERTKGIESKQWE